MSGSHGSPTAGGIPGVPAGDVRGDGPHRDGSGDGSGRLRVDMHTHTMWSGDCTTTPDELLAALSDRPVDVICITDHNTVNGAVELAGPVAEATGIRVIVGEEVRTHRGEIIGLFLTERIPGGLAPREVARRIRDQGGIVYIPHPFDPMRANLAAEVIEELVDAGLVDVIEGHNSKTSLPSLNRQAVTYARQRGLAVGAGSDAHVPEAIGSGHVLVPPFEDAAGFLAALADAEIVGRHCDPPRPWRPRIVPSTRAT